MGTSPTALEQERHVELAADRWWRQNWREVVRRRDELPSDLAVALRRELGFEKLLHDLTGDDGLGELAQKTREANADIASHSHTTGPLGRTLGIQTSVD